ncbi:MAG TPA: IclR family transcriptional regulator [Myxococcota bacterium]|nr:IclR family transcriptional regulator [Myxococcota bacterium]
MPPRKPKSDYAIQTVAHALRLLEEFRELDELGVTELSRRLNLHKNNVFRLLATLEQRGYIEQSASTERYRLGARCLALGETFCRSHPLLHQARAVLRSLANEVGETVHLAQMSGFEVVHLDAEVYHQPILAPSRIGERLPIHCTALGKVLLGAAPERHREAYDRTVVAGRGLPQRTRATIADPTKFFEEVRTAAGQGYALDIGECEDGLSCAAAPVYDRSGLSVAALSVSGPSFRLGTDALLRSIVPSLNAHADRLSRSLGHARD